MMSFLCPPGSRRGLQDSRVWNQGQWGAQGLRGEGSYLSGLQDKLHFRNSLQ